MKRSEMIKIMTDHWMGVFPGEEWDDLQLQSEIKQSMDKLLEAMEYKGMLPPTRARVEITDLKTMTGTWTAVNEWEPENA